MKNLRSRLSRLERGTAEIGCPACRARRGLFALSTGRQRADGTVVLEGERPRPCTRCGEIPEQFVEVMEVVIETREELKRWEARVASGTGASRRVTKDACDEERS
jgi:hypothetical protein